MTSAWKCDVSVPWGYDPTGENAATCGAASLGCIECGGPAGCAAHAHHCIRCGDPVCDGCAEAHACAMIHGGKAA